MGMNIDYHSLNLLSNPFGELRAEERGAIAVVPDLDSYLHFLRRSRRAMQFIGPCGFGKSTRLHAIAAAVADAQYVYLPESGKRPPLPRCRLAVIDEAQRLPAWRLVCLLASGQTLAIGTHRDRSIILRWCGYEVQTVRLGGQIVFSDLQRIIEKRIAAAVLDSRSRRPRVPTERLRELHRRFGGNVRAIEEELYEDFALSAAISSSEIVSIST